MGDNLRSYENILLSRKQDCSNFVWVSRRLNPQLAYKQATRPSPLTHKQSVLHNPKIQDLLNLISEKQNIPKFQLENQVKVILDEIGYNINLKVIRWLGLILVKICLKVSTGIYVNSDSLLQLKASMGDCPVIFVPSHRSYADFILMSYICFNYDIAIPAIAAGMDFHGMWGMGSILRDTGAFFMRRSYNDDKLYWATFKQYIYQLVTKGDLPIEFFIEGTRSRSNKFLTPKYGLISMILKPFFFCEVPDIKFVPIHISYDRILEETLFAFELLGVPKPKESTSGFFKSLKIIKENFGNFYCHFGQQISVKTFFGDEIDRTVHNLAPLRLQEMTDKEKSLIPSLSYAIVNTQQNCCVVTIFNLISLILNHNLVMNKQPMTIETLTVEVCWLKDIIQQLGAFVHSNSIEKSIEECFSVHKNLLQVQSDNKIYLIQNNIVLDKFDPSKLKAHSLSEKCMSYSVPFVMLQLYINPSLHYFIDLGLIVSILKYQKDLSEEKLFNIYQFFRSLFSVEFVIALPRVQTAFQSGIKQGLLLYVVKNVSEEFYELGPNDKLTDFLCTMFQPFIITYFVTLAVLEKSPVTVDEKTVLIGVQKNLENKIDSRDEFIHPYCLNLDTISNCLNILVIISALRRTRKNNIVTYEVKRNKITHIREELESCLSYHQVQYLCGDLSFQSKL